MVFSRDDQLATVALPWGRRFVQSVRRAGAESDFYAVDGLKDGEDAFEKVLSAVESDSARVFRAIRAGDWPLNSEDRGTLAYLIGSVAAAGV